jgi:hypothetical protein
MHLTREMRAPKDVMFGHRRAYIVAGNGHFTHYVLHVI